jgi:Cu+-exporting ATPase
MHPEIERDQPGDCPICGMALEPKTISAGSPPDDAELIDMTRRFWIGTALTLPVFLLAMSHLLPNAPAWLSGEASRWIQFALSTPVVLWAGWPFFKRGWRSLRTRNLNMFTLIAIGVAVAYFYSAAVMLFPGLFPASITHHGKLGIYFEAAAMITVLVLLAGKLVFLRENGVTDLEDLEAQALLLQDEGQTVIFVAMGARAGGMIAVADPIKESTPEAVREL